MWNYESKNQGHLRALILMLLLLSMVFAGCGKKKGTQEGGASATPDVTEAPVTTEVSEPEHKEPALSEEGQKINQFRLPEEGELCAEIVIRNHGSIYVKLFEEACPMAVENFTKLAKEGYYDEMKVDRVLAGYMFQAGDPKADGGSSVFGGGFKNEISEDILAYRGALCMANMGEDGTNTSQFFFVETPGNTLASMENPLDSRYRMDIYEYFREAYGVTITETQWNLFKQFGGAPQITGFNTVFGQTYSGFDVIDAVCDAKVTSKLRPNPSVVIETIKIFRSGVEE